MKFRILYGTEVHSVDVSYIAYKKCRVGEVLHIPSKDTVRSELFMDPVYGMLKQVTIYDENNVKTVYDDSKDIYIDLTYNKIYTDVLPSHIFDAISCISSEEKRLEDIHSRLQIQYGSLNDEYPEQLMAIKYLTGHEKVLEIGGNIGRNSLVIAKILRDPNSLVTLESNTEIATQLLANRELNEMSFHVEPSALSKRKLYQQGWDTITEEDRATRSNGDEFKEISTITLEELKLKYNVEFDTLILDCEGAFYHILMDMPEILNGITLIIMENDYWDITRKRYIDGILKRYDFKVDFSQSGGWGPCYDFFYEVWVKDTFHKYEFASLKVNNFVNSDFYCKLPYFVNPSEKYNVLEVGSFEGLSTVYLSDMLLNHADSKLTSFDAQISAITINTTSTHVFEKNIKNSKNTDKVVLSSSFPEQGSYDLIYIDGCYNFKQTQHLLETVFHKLNLDGIMWINDYNHVDIQRRNAVNEFLVKFNESLKVIYMNTNEAILLWKIPSA